MSVTLKILWDGDAPGLNEHLLDLGTFGEPIHQLDRALKSIASAKVAQVTDPSYGMKGGRRPARARRMRVFLRQVHEGCAQPEFVLQMDPAPLGQMEVFEDLPEQTVEEFVKAVDVARAGGCRWGAVNHFLRTVPDGVRHEYRAIVDGKEVAFAAYNGGAPIPDEHPIPFTIRGIGRVAGARFIDGHSLAIKHDGHTVTFDASPELVAYGVERLNADLWFAALSMPGTKRPRLIKLIAASEMANRPSTSQTAGALAARWSTVLSALGEGPK